MLERNLVAGIEHDPAVGLELEVLLARLLPALVEQAVVVDVADRHAGGEGGGAAEVVEVVVGGDEVVDVLHPGLGGGLVDPAGVAVAGVAGVDQHRFAGGRDDERGGSPFDVDPDDVEAAVGLAGAKRRGQDHEDEEKKQVAGGGLVHGGWCYILPAAAVRIAGAAGRFGGRGGEK